MSRTDKLRAVSSERMKTWGLHLSPILIGVSSVLALYGANPESVRPTEVLLPLAAVIAVAAGLLLGLKSVGMEASAAGLAAWVIVLFFITYGHLYEQVEGVKLFGFMVGRHRFLLPGLAIIAAAATASASVRPGVARVMAPALVTTSVVLFLFSGFSAARGYWENRGLFQGRGPGGSGRGGPGAAEVGPDIYYIVLDGHGRADVLKELYDYDAGEFLGFLESRGFYVAGQSKSNYIQTALSLASSLNMAYLEEVASEHGTELNESSLRGWIWDNTTFALLSRAGYEIVAFESGYPRTELKGVDHYLEPPRVGIGAELSAGPSALSPFQVMYLDTTVPGKLVAIYQHLTPDQRSVYESGYARHRRRIQFTLDRLPEIARRPGSYFVFAHLVTPHPPFVYDSSGNPVSPDRPYSLVDGTDYMEVGTRTEYIQGYRGQISYLHRLLMPVIDEILRSADEPPIIILQGDHGPGAYLDWESVENTNLHERTAILNAYFVPESVQRRLYPSITPVNSFRLVLPQILGLAPMSLLPDRAYYSTHEGWLEFVLVDGG